MDCIEAIEEVIKSILRRLHELCIEDRVDDTEYIRKVKAVLEATDIFLRDNKKFSSDAQTIQEALYSFSKSLWLEHLETTNHKDAVIEDEELTAKHNEYYDYYYDYIYHHGVYPR